MCDFFKYFRFLYYFYDNQNLFIISIELFCGFILLNFILYLYLVILSINGKKIEKKTIIKLILRTSMEIMNSILIVPLEGIFFNNLNYFF